MTKLLWDELTHTTYKFKSSCIFWTAKGNAVRLQCEAVCDSAKRDEVLLWTVIPKMEYFKYVLSKLLQTQRTGWLRHKLGRVGTAFLFLTWLVCTIGRLGSLTSISALSHLATFYLAAFGSSRYWGPCSSPMPCLNHPVCSVRFCQKETLTLCLAVLID